MKDSTLPDKQEAHCHHKWEFKITEVPAKEYSWTPNIFLS